jgi:hypothetical protein
MALCRGIAGQVGVGWTVVGRWFEKGKVVTIAFVLIHYIPWWNGVSFAHNACIIRRWLRARLLASFLPSLSSLFLAALVCLYSFCFDILHTRSLYSSDFVTTEPTSRSETRLAPVHLGKPNFCHPDRFRRNSESVNLGGGLSVTI